MTSLAGKAAIVTGGASGIGKAIVEAFAANGATVFIADIDEEGAGRVAAATPGAASARLDVGDPASWTEVVGRALGHLGGLDVLVNNAGIVHHGAIEEIALADFERVIRVNQIGVLLGMQAVIPALRERGGGSIVNMSSVRGLSGANGLGAYVATKFAVRGLTKVAALELGRFGIRVNSIHPGSVATEGMLGAAMQHLDAVDARFADQPIPRIGRAADIAGMAVFLASDASAYCTGAEFVVDGGVSAGVRRPGSPGY